MAPLIFPPVQTERFLVSGTTALTLTQEQREARTCTITIEKVRAGAVAEYYNFRVPEPQSFWGYVQLMRRDFVAETLQLQYRRESLLTVTEISPVQTEQLSCLVRNATGFLFSSLEPLLLAAGVNAEQLGEDKAKFALASAQPYVLPVNPLTALWIEIEPSYSGFVTISWGGYPSPCENLMGAQPAANAPAPGKGDSGGPGGGGAGGGGERPNNPLPPNRTADPLSDSAGPPSPGSSPPDSPVSEPPFSPPVRGRYRVVVGFAPFSGSPPNCVAEPTSQQEYIVFPGPALLERIAGASGGYTWKLFNADGGELVSLSGGSIAGGCENVNTIISQSFMSET